MIRLACKQLEHIVANFRSYPINALELCGGSFIDGQKPKVAIRYLNKGVRTVDDIGEDFAFRQHSGNALFECVVQGAQLRLAFANDFLSVLTIGDISEVDCQAPAMRVDMDL